jgi:hypothetical protein
MTSCVEVLGEPEDVAVLGGLACGRLIPRLGGLLGGRFGVRDQGRCGTMTRW